MSCLQGQTGREREPRQLALPAVAVLLTACVGAGFGDQRLQPEPRGPAAAASVPGESWRSTTKPAPGVARRPARRLTNDDPQILAWLKELKPLPKVHYSSRIPGELLDNPNDRRLLEYARITHALSINDWTTPRQIQSAVIICRYVNLHKPRIPATIGVNYSPWHRVYPKEAPPTDFGRAHHAEIARFRQKLTGIIEVINQANSRYQTDIKISAVLFDTERFNIKPGNETWNRAITAKYDAFYDIARALLPAARIEWYGRGVYHSAPGFSWSRSSRFTLEEKAETFSCRLYCVPELGYTLETFRQTYRLAKSYGADEVTPYVALGAGYRRRTDRFHEWHWDWDYDVVYSWLIGAQLNRLWYAQRAEKFAPWDAAKVVFLYPAPFNPRTPAWAKHFVAYVRGATGIEELPGDGRSK